MPNDHSAYIRMPVVHTITASTYYYTYWSLIYITLAHPSLEPGALVVKQGYPSNPRIALVLLLLDHSLEGRHYFSEWLSFRATRGGREFSLSDHRGW